MNDSPSLDLAEQCQSKRGRWKKGESGNPAGYHAGQRHKATILAQRLFQGESDEICRAVIAQAKAGDVTAQRLCLERICPPLKSYPFKFKLPPLRTIGDAQSALAAIAAGTAAGTILTDEALALSNIVSSYIKSIQIVEIEARLNALEQATQPMTAAQPYNA